MKSNKDTLQELIDRADVLIERNVRATDPDFAAWRNKCIRFLFTCYGQGSFQAQSFVKMHFTLLSYGTATPEWKWHEACVQGLKRAKAIFTDYLNEIEDVAVPVCGDRPNMNNKDVFVVHGHDRALKEAVARLLEKVGLNAIILGEQPNGGKTIIEKFENYSNVGAAICLFTADDLVQSDDGTTRKRARQNVVFETGYFYGALGRDRTIVLADKEVEILSDMQGVLYTDVQNWNLSVCKELKAMGYEIDLNALAPSARPRKPNASGRS